MSTKRSGDNPAQQVKRRSRKRPSASTAPSTPNTAIQKPLLLDLFCGAGGAGVGYSRAGFEVVGVDLVAQPHYPFVFRQGDALTCLDALLAGREWGGYVLSDFAAIHASPPCQAYSLASLYYRIGGKEYPDLIAPTRDMLTQSPIPWVMENVPGAPLLNPIMLCGSMFGLGVQRHRYFESPWFTDLLFAPFTCRHDYIPIAVCGNGTPSWYKKRSGKNASVADKKLAMGIDWMNRAELSQAIPPVYTEWLGRQLLAVIEHGKAVA